MSRDAASVLVLLFLWFQPEVAVKFRILTFPCLHNFYGIICAVKLKELERNFLVLEFDKKRSKNEELLDLGLEVPCKKSVQSYMSFNTQMTQ